MMWEFREKKELREKTEKYGKIGSEKREEFVPGVVGRVRSLGLEMLVRWVWWRECGVLF
jgi:hypothetical protein